MERTHPQNCQEYFSTTVQCPSAGKIKSSLFMLTCLPGRMVRGEGGDRDEAEEEKDQDQDEDEKEETEEGEQERRRE